MADESTHFADTANDALDRLKRAYDRNTGCHLSRDMVAALGLTFLAETWNQERPTA